MMLFVPEIEENDDALISIFNNIYYNMGNLILKVEVQKNE